MEIKNIMETKNIFQNKKGVFQTFLIVIVTIAIIALLISILIPKLGYEIPNIKLVTQESAKASEFEVNQINQGIKVGNSIINFLNQSINFFGRITGIGFGSKNEFILLSFVLIIFLTIIIHLSRTLSDFSTFSKPISILLSILMSFLLLITGVYTLLVKGLISIISYLGTLIFCLVLLFGYQIAESLIAKKLRKIKKQKEKQEKKDSENIVKGFAKGIKKEVESKK